MRGKIIYANKLLLGRFQSRRPIRVVFYRLVCILNRQYVRKCLDLSGAAQGLDISSSEHGNMTLCSLRVGNCVSNWLTVRTVPCGVSYEQGKSKIRGRWRKETYLFWLEPSRCVIQYKYQLKDYSIQSENKQIIYYQSINLETCFGSINHHQANSQTILEVHSLDVYILGSQMFTNRMTIKGKKWLFGSQHYIIKLSQYVVIRVFLNCLYWD